MTNCYPRADGYSRISSTTRENTEVNQTDSRICLKLCNTTDLILHFYEYRINYNRFLAL